MKKITEALSKLLPDEQVSEVSEAVNEMLAEARSELEKEYNAKLEEAYAELSEELANAEKTAEQGYEEAYTIIGELRNRLEKQGEEYKQALEEGYEDAYQMILSEREKKNSVEVDMYEEYDKKLGEMKGYVVDKLDEFLQVKGSEIYEQAKRDVVNDPRMAEHKVALDKIVDIAANYLSEEDYAMATSSKLDEVRHEVDELKGQLRIMESRNIRLSTENNKLNEAFSHAQELLVEHEQATEKGNKRRVLNEQNERKGRSKNVTGRGRTNTDGEEVITESKGNDSRFNELLVLSGLKQPE